MCVCEPECVRMILRRRRTSDRYVGSSFNIPVTSGKLVARYPLRQCVDILTRVIVDPRRESHSGAKSHD